MALEVVIGLLMTSFHAKTGDTLNFQPGTFKVSECSWASHDGLYSSLVNLESFCSRVLALNLFMGSHKVQVTYFSSQEYLVCSK